MRKGLAAAITSAFLAVLAGTAAAHGPHAPASGPHAAGGHEAHGVATASDAAGELVAGEVRRIDKDRQRLTLRHGEIRILGMPPMTMVFRVKDPAWLDQVKVGDTVSFRAENIDGAYTVTELRPAK